MSELPFRTVDISQVRPGDRLDIAAFAPLHRNDAPDHYVGVEDGDEAADRLNALVAAGTKTILVEAVWPDEIGTQVTANQVSPDFCVVFGFDVPVRVLDTTLTTETAAVVVPALLDGVSTGDWRFINDDGLVSLVSGNGRPIATDLNPKDAALLAAAPSLARMLIPTGN